MEMKGKRKWGKGNAGKEREELWKKDMDIKKKRGKKLNIGSEKRS